MSMVQWMLLTDIGSTWTKGTLVDLSKGCVAGKARAVTSLEEGIAEGVRRMTEDIEAKTGLPIRKMRSEGALEMRFCSSAAGGLRMVAVGLVPELTVEAARRAAAGAGAKVTATFGYELTEEDVDDITSLHPDIVLLCGGTDGGNSRVILSNAERLTALPAVIPVVYAGNRQAAKEAVTLLEAGGRSVYRCSNVMPKIGELDILPAQAAIRACFLAHIIRAKGLEDVERDYGPVEGPTPWAVLRAIDLLGRGTERAEGLGSLMAVDPGGATTDVYSYGEGLPAQSGVILRGLQESLVKRTVEGDLGLRHSAAHVAEAAGGTRRLSALAGLDEATVASAILRMQQHPEMIHPPGSPGETLDYAVTLTAIREAAVRHAGWMEEHYTPAGKAYVQTGKDMTNARWLIGTGGPVIHSADPARLLKSMTRQSGDPARLLPEHPEMLLDKDYLLSAMGLLAGSHPETAFMIMRNHLVRI